MEGCRPGGRVSYVLIVLGGCYTDIFMPGACSVHAWCTSYVCWWMFVICWVLRRWYALGVWLEGALVGDGRALRAALAEL